MNDEKQEVNLDESNGKRLVSEKLDAGYSEYVMGRRPVSYTHLTLPTKA